MRTKRYIIVLCSTIVSLVLLNLGDKVIQKIHFNNMLIANARTSRVVDGAQNLFFLYGNSGLVGSSRVYVKYDGDGNVIVKGSNKTSDYQWKKLAETSIIPGNYTFTGLNGVKENTVKLQLSYENDDETATVWHYLWDEDIHFEIKEEKKTELFIMIYPNSEIDVVARPALYRDK